MSEDNEEKLGKELEKLFGEPEYGEDGEMIFTTRIEPFGHGFDIRYGAKGFGFGGCQIFYRDGKMQADTECLDADTLAPIIRQAAAQLAEYFLSLDPKVEKP